LPDVFCQASRTQAALNRYVLDELSWSHSSFRRRSKFGTTADGGICLSDHVTSIAERLELLFSRGFARHHPGDARPHRVAPTALIADECAPEESDFASVNWTGEQSDDPGLQSRRRAGTARAFLPVGNPSLVSHARRSPTRVYRLGMYRRSAGSLRSTDCRSCFPRCPGLGWRRVESEN
jgi:hypothetical protein